MTRKDKSKNRLSKEEIIKGQKKALKSEKTPDQLKDGLRKHLKQKGEL